MKRLAVLAAALLSAIGCATPTEPAAKQTADRAEGAKAQLQGATRGTSPGRIALN